MEETEAVPVEGTFSFDKKLFMVNYSEEMDLAAIDARIAGALEDALGRKGFRRVESEPDVLVSYAVAIDSAISGSDLNDIYEDDLPLLVPEPDSDRQLNYKQGTLILDFIDAKTRKLLWRGAVMADFNMRISEKQKELRARKGVQILLDNFPEPRMKKEI